MDGALVRSYRSRTFDPPSQHIREVLSTKASSFSKDHTAFNKLSRILGEGLFTRPATAIRGRDSDA